MQSAKAQTTENRINTLLVTMGLKVDEAVSRAIAALLNSNSHVVAGVLESVPKASNSKSPLSVLSA